MQKPTIEALKELIRTFILGELLVLIGVLGVIYSGINQQLGTFVIEWNVALAVLVGGSITNLQTALAAAVDKFLHEHDVKTPLDLRGLDSLKN